MENNPSIREFNYHLPAERIALFPLPDRDASKLLVYRNGHINDDTFYHLPGYLGPGSTVVLNNTRVIEARVFFQKESGGTIEIFCLEPSGTMDLVQAMSVTGTTTWNCLIGGASKWKAGQVLRKVVFIDQQPVTIRAAYETREADHFRIRFAWDSEDPFAAVLHAAGAIPLPPYIKRKAVDTDAERYQTVFAEQKGSVAAPTAALHFTSRVLRELKQRKIETAYLTLHVGAGTFKPVKTEHIRDHPMHAESFAVRAATIEALMAASRITAVGTTSLRALESLHWLGVKLIGDPDLEDLTLAQWEAYELNSRYSFRDSCHALLEHMKRLGRDQVWCRTSLLIMPGYRFASAEALVTNFHQPGSTLLLLVAAFIGQDWKKVYEHALANGYRFLSYGDSSLLFRAI